ncbi:MAG: hypothetical protein ABIH78_04385 [Candidatus Peregrinibacteria bacterium]
MGKDKKRKIRMIEKLLMGAVIGGAIGSVVGATIAPKKGKETRAGIFKTIKVLLGRKKEKKIPNEHE